MPAGHEKQKQNWVVVESDSKIGDDHFLELNARLQYKGWTTHWSLLVGKTCCFRWICIKIRLINKL